MLTSDTQRQPRRNNHHRIATVSVIRRPMVVDMKPDIQDIRSKIQDTLDELMSENLIPFKLTAHAISADGLGKYVVPFYDSRIHSFMFSWPNESSSFHKVIRAAVLDRVRAIDGPPRDWKPSLARWSAA